MVLIIGGKYQGKLDYALHRFKYTQDDIWFCDENNTDMPKDKKIIYEIDRWILALLKKDMDVEKNMESLLTSNPQVIIYNDISCGVVPIDPLMRLWRDTAGRSVGLMARLSEEVIRLFCGIPTKI
jgi:adenosyl cobinamide kinase/adenosyl cobinamide phosphate guanylyltransferase